MLFWGRMVKRWDVINALGAALGRPWSYLEIGCQTGACARQVRAQSKWGVDPNPIGTCVRHYTKFHTMGSDEFFALPRPQFDVIFIDGLHEAEQVLRDVDNALSVLAPGGAIVMHDCNPAQEIHQRVPRESGVWNGDTWKAMVALRRRPNLEAYTLDTDEGLGIVRPSPGATPAITEPIAGPIGWAGLQRNRGTWLGLRPCLDAKAALPHVPDTLGRVVVVSAIFGGRDTPRPAPQASDVDEFVMFTDDRPNAVGWGHLVGYPEMADSTLTGFRAMARAIKTQALDLLPHADVVVWVDGRIQVTDVPLRPLLAHALAKHDIAGFPHPWRRSAYAEARECEALGLAPAQALRAQEAAYRVAGLPEASGLWNTMVLARRNTPAMRELGRAWWHEICTHTVRDQISLPYVLWRQGITMGRLGRDVYYDKSSAHFIRGRHAK